MTREARQRQQIVAALARRHFARVLVLCREHLSEYPDDVDVQRAAEQAARAWPRRDNER